MKWIHRLAFFVLLSLTVAAGSAIAGPQNSAKPVAKQKSNAQPPAMSKQDEIARGKYLVEQVARCPDCHTPHDVDGNPEPSHWLQGGPVWIKPVQSKQPWSEQAPSLAGFPYSDQQGQDVLERGIGTNGIPIQPPMHAYHLHHEDAVAIIAYLRSVKRGS